MHAVYDAMHAIYDTMHAVYDAMHAVYDTVQYMTLYAKVYIMYILRRHIFSAICGAIVHCIHQLSDNVNCGMSTVIGVLAAFSHVKGMIEHDKKM